VKSDKIREADSRNMRYCTVTQLHISAVGLDRILILNFDFLPPANAAVVIRSVKSVCLSVCNALTFESLD